MNEKKVFIVEDDLTLATLIKKHLDAWGYKAFCAENFENILDDFIKFEPDIVLLDIKLPHFNGYYWCNEIRKISNVPIVFISSAADNMNIIMAMNMGGDDFIAKPFDINVLIAKIQAVIRRSYDFVDKLQVIACNGALLNLNNMSISYKEEEIELTKNEFKILQTLMENAGKVVSRNTLMTRLWENDMYVEENTLTVNINRLRKKLEKINLHNFIETKPGSGYLISK